MKEIFNSFKEMIELLLLIDDQLNTTIKVKKTSAQKEQKLWFKFLIKEWEVIKTSLIMSSQGEEAKTLGQF